MVILGLLKSSCHMIKISDLQRRRPVTWSIMKEHLMEGEKQAVDNVQSKMAQTSTGNSVEFWYETDKLAAIPLSDAALKKLHFERIDEEDGGLSI